MPRTSEANEKIKQERRENILTGALELFVRNGLAGTKIGDIAKKVSMSNGLVYHYFSSKEEIFVELIRDALDRMGEACDFLEASALEPHEKIRFAMEELTRIIRSDPHACLYHVLVSQAAACDNIPVPAKEIVEEKRHRPYEAIAGIMAQGQKLRTIRQGNPNDLAFFFWNTVNGLAIHQAMYGRSAQSPELEPVFHMFFETEGK